MFVCVVVCFVLCFIRCLRIVLLWMGNSFIGLYEELLNILFFGVQHRVAGLTFFLCNSCKLPFYVH